jgi:hypothetical protein
LSHYYTNCQLVYNANHHSSLVLLPQLIKFWEEWRCKELLKNASVSFCHHLLLSR